MRRVVLVGLIACGAGKPAPPAPPIVAAPVDAAAPVVTVVPDAAPPSASACLPGGEGRLALAGASLVACTKALGDAGEVERCVEVSQAGVGKPVPPPPATTPRALASATIRDAGTGKVAACNGGTCKPFGKRLLAAIDKQKQENAKNEDTQPIALSATDDLAVVVVEGKPWRLAEDRPLALVPPASYAKLSSILHWSAEVMGNWLVSWWTTCAGPCEKEIVTGTNGKHHGETFDAGPFLRLDDRRVAVISAQQAGGVTLLDLVTGDKLGAADLGGGEDFVHPLLLDAHTFAFMAGGFDVTWIDVTTNTPKKIASIAIPVCP